MKNKFNITFIYKKLEKPLLGMSKCKHIIIEKFEGVSGKDVPNLLIEMLDVPFENDKSKRIVVEPSIDRLKENYCCLDSDLDFDEGWAKREVTREKKAKAAYDELIYFMNGPTVYGPFEINVDRNTSVVMQFA